MKIFRVVILFFIALPVIAQDEIKPRLRKNERILLAAYDDTTRALARLFIDKREACRRRLYTTGVIGGVAAFTAASAELILENYSAQGPGGQVDPEYSLVLGIMVVGVVCIISSGIVTGLTLILKNPYTIKKYLILIDWYRAGRPWPDFYQKRVVPYL